MMVLCFGWDLQQLRFSPQKRSQSVAGFPDQAATATYAATTTHAPLAQVTASWSDYVPVHKRMNMWCCIPQAKAVVILAKTSTIAHAMASKAYIETQVPILQASAAKLTLESLSQVISEEAE